MKATLLVILSLVTLSYASNQGIVTGNPTYGEVVVSSDSSDWTFYSGVTNPTATTFTSGGNIFFSNLQLRDTTITLSMVDQSGMQDIVPITEWNTGDPNSFVTEIISNDDNDSSVYVLTRREDLGVSDYAPNLSPTYPSIQKVSVEDGDYDVLYSADETDPSQPLPTSMWVGDDFIFFTANQVDPENEGKSGIWKIPTDGGDPTLVFNVQEVDSGNSTIDSLSSLDGETFFYIITSFGSSYIQSVDITTMNTMNSDNSVRPDQIRIYSDTVVWARDGGDFYKGTIGDDGTISLSKESSLSVLYDVSDFDVDSTGSYLTFLDIKTPIIHVADIAKQSISTAASGITLVPNFNIDATLQYTHVFYTSYDRICMLSIDNLRSDDIDFSTLFFAEDIIVTMGAVFNDSQTSFYYSVSGSKNISSDQYPTVVTDKEVTLLTVDNQEYVVYFTTQSESDVTIYKFNVGERTATPFLLIDNLREPLESLTASHDGFLYYSTSRGVSKVDKISGYNYGLTLPYSESVIPYSLDYSSKDILSYLNIEPNSFVIGTCQLKDGKCVSKFTTTINQPNPDGDTRAWMVSDSHSILYWTADLQSGNIYSFDTGSMSELPTVIHPVVDDAKVTGMAITPDDDTLIVATGSVGVFKYNTTTGESSGVCRFGDYNVGAIAVSSDAFYWVNQETGSINTCSANCSDCDNSVILLNPEKRDCQEYQFLTLDDNNLYYQNGCGGISSFSLDGYSDPIPLQQPNGMAVADMVTDGSGTVFWALPTGFQVMEGSIHDNSINSQSTLIVGTGFFYSLSVHDSSTYYWVDPNAQREMLFDGNKIQSVDITSDCSGVGMFTDEATVVPTVHPLPTGTSAVSHNPVPSKSPSSTQTYKFSGSTSNAVSNSNTLVRPPFIQKNGWITIGSLTAAAIIFCCLPITYCCWINSKEKELALSLRFMDDDLITQ